MDDTRARPRQAALAGGIFARMFVRPEGRLGQLGGWILALEKRAFLPWVVEQMDVQPDDRVLEVGFGPGVALGYLAQGTPQGYVIGIDVSDVMVNQARTRNAKAIATGHVKLHQGKAECLPFADASMDKVLSVNSVQTWLDPAAGLREVHRVLKPGGRLTLGLAGPARPFEPQEAELLGESGFQVVRRAAGSGGVCLLSMRP